MAEAMARWTEFEQPLYHGGDDSRFELEVACNWSSRRNYESNPAGAAGARIVSLIKPQALASRSRLHHHTTTSSRGNSRSRLIRLLASHDEDTCSSLS
jgi:hypothetical protein